MEDDDDDNDAFETFQYRYLVARRSIYVFSIAEQSALIKLQQSPKTVRYITKV